ncbi:MAG: thioredoxin [Firmicutes bacterium]|nr:thioredoxin [Bacillota bacterium]
MVAMLELTDSNFQSEVLEQDGVVLVDFWAPWCGPCRMIAPIVEEIAKEYAGKAVVGKLNVDENPNTAGKYSVMSIPTLMFFKNGEVVDQIVGAQPKQNITEKLDAHLG